MTAAQRDEDAPYAAPPGAEYPHEPGSAAAAARAAGRGGLDVAGWRKAERARLIEARLSLPAATRRGWSERIASHLAHAIGDARGLIVSAYWPFRGEPDLRALLGALDSSGARTALPVVVARGRPLIFREWKAGDPLERGVWNIPIPAAGVEVTPDVVIAPVVGFDPAHYRLGYGGGFFDRTLAAMAKRPRAFGVGYSIAAIATIHPQAHDIPMDAVITELGMPSEARPATGRPA